MLDDLTRRLDTYVALRIALGFSMHMERYVLEDFVRFVQEHGAVPIRAQTAVAWACQQEKRRGRTAQAQRLTVVRGFLRHLRATEPATEVPDVGLLGRGPRRSNPYLLTDDDVLRLIAAARCLRPRGSLRPHVYSTLFGLLAATGLRIGEALRLTTGDVLLDVDPPRLRITDSKFGKSRWVPLHPSTAEMLTVFAQERRRLRVDAVTDVFFASERATVIEASLAQSTFRRLCQKLELDPEDGRRRPTWHAFRHRFAVQRLTTWYEQGLDVAALIPNLSVYLGHVSPSETYWYLRATPALLSAAATSFERFAGAGGER
jgi:integrase/recombinase XerD